MKRGNTRWVNTKLLEGNSIGFFMMYGEPGREHITIGLIFPKIDDSYIFYTSKNVIKPIQCDEFATILAETEFKPSERATRLWKLAKDIYTQEFDACK